MKVESIIDEARESLIGILNKTLQIEYGFILNYPRMIEKLEHIDNIHDEKLNNDLKILGTDSIEHFYTVDTIIKKLGGKPEWDFGVIGRLQDVREMLEEQLNCEKEVELLYLSASRLVNENRQKMKVGTFINRLVRKYDDSLEGVIVADELIPLLERIVAGERKHIRICEDAISTLEMLESKKRKLKKS